MARNLSFSFGVIAVMLLASGEPTLARAIVINAVGPSAPAFTKGDVLDDKVRVRLKRGDLLTVLVEGQTVLIRGPRECLVNACESREPPKISWASVSGDLRRPRAAGVRGGDGEPILAAKAP